MHIEGLLHWQVHRIWFRATWFSSPLLKFCMSTVVWLFPHQAVKTRAVAAGQQGIATAVDCLWRATALMLSHACHQIQQSRLPVSMCRAD